MHIAYLILAHDNYIHLERLITALQDKNCKFYIHIDKKSTLPNIKGQNIFFIRKREKVYWAGFSQVRATLNLLERSIKDRNDYYVFISGTDYPVRPNKYLYETLQKGGEFIDIKKGEDPPFNPLSRYTYYYFTDFYNRRNKDSIKAIFFKGLQTLLRISGIKRQIPFQFYTGSQWFILSHKCVQYVLNEVEVNKQYTQFFKWTFCPDESFVHSIIGNSKFYDAVRGNLTYADWSVNPPPAMINEKHTRLLKEGAKMGNALKELPFFARKFADDSKEIIELIERELRIEDTSLKMNRSLR
jgi:hypothetical protein